MHPRLVSVAGPPSGNAFPLSGEEMCIGREGTNWICIADLSASRRHCMISRAGDDFQITDLDSRNGTFVNGVPIGERILRHGDRIDVGKCGFVFLMQDEENPAQPEEDLNLALVSTTRLSITDALYLHPEKLLSAQVATDRVVHGLDLIVRYAKSLQSSRSMKDLQEALFEAAFEATPAQRASFVVLRPGSCEAVSVQTADRHRNGLHPFLSLTVLRLVVNEREALMSNEVAQDLSSESLTSVKVTSIIAVPMVCRDIVHAVLCLFNTDSACGFTDDHLQIMSALGGMSGLAIDNIRFYESVQHDHNNLVEDLRLQHSMIGESAAMKNVYTMISKVAPSDANVLICGESGTGKELAARAIHLSGPRSKKAFVAINCANLSETLLESELFGHEKGAFTGAIALKKGKIELADGGTLFLDEISEIPASLQARLLRFIQEREFERVGGTRPITVDVRIVAATNRDLEKALEDGTFRNDLYYRLNVIKILMPSLRERREDIPLLASYFISRCNKKGLRKILGLHESAKQCLLKHTWPGNVRELENVIQRAAILGTEDHIRIEDLPEELLEALDAPGTRYIELLKDAKRKLLQQVLRQVEGNHNEAAKTLGMHPNNLRRLVKSLNL